MCPPNKNNKTKQKTATINAYMHAQHVFYSFICCLFCECAHNVLQFDVSYYHFFNFGLFCIHTTSLHDSLVEEGSLLWSSSRCFFHLLPVKGLFLEEFSISKLKVSGGYHMLDRLSLEANLWFEIMGYITMIWLDWHLLIHTNNTITPNQFLAHALWWPRILSIT